MKKILLILGAVLLLALPATALAATFSSTADNGNYTLAKDQVVDDDLYVAAGNATVNGKVNGDLFVFAGQARIDGDVEGDLYVCSGNVTISGNVKDDLKVAGGTVIVESKIGGDVMIAGGTVEIASSADIGGDIYSGAGNLTISGAANKVKATVGTLTLGKSANIKGDIEYWSDVDITIENGAKHAGSLTKRQTEIKRDVSNYYLGKKFAWVGSMIATFIILLILCAIFPKRTRAYAQDWRKSFGKNFLAGFLFLIALPIAAIILLISMIFSPFGIGGFLIYPIFIYVGMLIAMLGIGAWVMSLVDRDPRKYSAPLSALVGVIIYTLLDFVPIVGWLAKFLAVAAGIGIAWGVVWNFLSVRKAKKLL